MNIKTMHQTIAMAKSHEQKTGHLAKRLEQHLVSNIHIAIQLPKQDPVKGLLSFVIAYIERVPSFLEAAKTITGNANINEYAEPFLQLAEDFFLKPPEIIAGHIGLDELMAEAYLAHRLMEEVNDRFMLRTSIPLIPMDMTLSNLVIHNLLGEQFANQLDGAIERIVQTAMLKEHVYESREFKSYVDKHKNNQWQQEYQHWPCLMDKLAINLQFTQ